MQFTIDARFRSWVLVVQILFWLQCQMAAIEELFGDVKECERRYMSAQVLLHSLVQRHPLHPHHRTTLSKCEYLHCSVIPQLIAQLRGSRSWHRCCRTRCYSANQCTQLIPTVAHECFSREDKQAMLKTSNTEVRPHARFLLMADTATNFLNTPIMLTWSQKYLFLRVISVFRPRCSTKAAQLPQGAAQNHGCEARGRDLIMQ